MICRTALGYLESPFISVTALVADTMVKAARIRLLGLEPTGIETIVIRIEADGTDAVVAALDAGVERARQLGVAGVPVAVQSNPSEPMRHLNDRPVTINPLYGGREEMRPSAQPIDLAMKNQAIGILETQGLTAVLQATDTMLKTASVQLVGKEKIGAAYVAIVVSGDVAAVKAAVDAGAEAVGSLGKLVAAHVIARPHEDLLALLPAS